MIDDALKRRFDESILPLLLPLRTDNVLDDRAYATFLDVVNEIASVLHGHDLVPRALVGELWYVYVAMVTAAAYAPDPAALNYAIGIYEERLISMFGPTFR